MFAFIWKYSRRDQIILLCVTVLLFPLLYLTLELPKRIINDAIGAPSSNVVFFGYDVDQVTLLGIFCGAFLLSVFAHGLLKMRINTMKGVLAERMLRRLRYTLIGRVFRFPQSFFQRTSQGELVSIVTAETEPMGGMMGDALTQPILQAGQMLTILGFLFLQSIWFGIAAVALIPLQAWLIPKLQRQINLMNKSRIKEVRKLAAEIGENAAGSGTLRIHGGWRYRKAMITRRLGVLFDIRFQIYQKKFFMKFLNNFITQLTPFFFFSVGGYLVIRGNVSIGALVAALAAYKDLSSPWKELLAYYNQAQDMSLRWEVVTERFSPSGMIDETLFDGEPDRIPELKGEIELTDVTVFDVDGNAVLEDISARFPPGALVAIAAQSQEDRSAFAGILTREILPTAGTIKVAGYDLSHLHQSVIAARIGHANSRPVMFRGTFGENVLMPLMQRPQAEAGQSAETDRITLEGIRAGNSPDSIDENWLNPASAGVESASDLLTWWLKIVDAMGSGTTLFRRGLDQSFSQHGHPELARNLIELRPKIRRAIDDAGLNRHMCFFDAAQFNPALPVAGNLFFVTPQYDISQSTLAAQSDVFDVIHSLRLDKDLMDLAQEIIEMLRQIFGTDGTDHPLFRKLGLEPALFERSVQIAANYSAKGAVDLPAADKAVLMTVPFRISEEQIGPAISDQMKVRILELRRAHAQEFQSKLRDTFTPLSEVEIAPGLSVLENAMFGKISSNAGAQADEIRKIVSQEMLNAGLRPLVIELIYDLQIALGGSNLPALFAEPLAFSRAAIKRPDVLVLDQTLASYDGQTQAAVHKNLRNLMPDATLIYIDTAFQNREDFDVYLEIQQGRIVSSDTSVSEVEDGGGQADILRKLRALEATPLFSGLSRKQLRLLAFSARWYNASAGDVIFNKSDDPTDGAYVILSGEAGLYDPDSHKDALIATVGPGNLVGELGVIRNIPRALTMRAHSDLETLRLGSEDFLAVVENDAATSFKLLQVVSGYVS
ncbi:MAG: ABC transporter transmembrane domain-containing protein [Sulfitobacter sp.]